MIIMNRTIKNLLLSNYNKKIVYWFKDKIQLQKNLLVNN